jgi:hypothetical protein
MLAHNNNIVSVYRLTDTAWERWYVSAVTWLSVYLQSKEDRIESGFDNQGAFFPFLMMTNWKPNILIWDKITDREWNAYHVRWAQTFKDLTWTHSEYSLSLKYD